MAEEYTEEEYLEDKKERERIFEEFRKDQAESLKKLIPELQERRGKHFNRRMFIAFVVIWAIIAYTMSFILGHIPFFTLLCLSAVCTVVFLFITYIVSAFTFGNASHEYMIIQKMITEYCIYTKGYDDSMDTLLEMGKFRNFL